MFLIYIDLPKLILFFFLNIYIYIFGFSIRTNISYKICCNLNLQSYSIK